MSFVNYNGKIFSQEEAILSSNNLALRQGEGLIETMLLRNGTIRFLDEHLERLYRSADLLDFTPFIRREEVVEELKKTIYHNAKASDGILRFQIFPSEIDNQISFLVNYIARRKAVNVGTPVGLSMGITTKAIKCFDSISHLKTSSRLLYNVAKKEARQNNWDDALLINQYGRIVESTIANVFVVKANNIFTPPLSEGCVEGVFRKNILSTDKLAVWNICEKQLTIEDFTVADEIFLTNAVRGIQPVSSFNGQTYNTDISVRISELINQY